MKRKVAVFDIDGTIFRSSLLVELTEALIKAQVFPVTVRSRYLREYKAWFNRRGSYDCYLGKLIAVFDASIKGVRRNIFLRIAKGVIRAQRERTYRYTRNLIRTLRQRGYYLLAISHSPKYIVHAFAKRLGFNKVYGRMLEVDADGRFTGKTLHEDIIMDKARILSRAVEKERLTLTNSIGVGDSESDIPFLEMTKGAIAFNPNRKLYRHAKRRGWRIVVERKDMVYVL